MGVWEYIIIIMIDTCLRHDFFPHDMIRVPPGGFGFRRGNRVGFLYSVGICVFSQKMKEQRFYLYVFEAIN